jgi:TBC1 domain family protein 5
VRRATYGRLFNPSTTITKLKEAAVHGELLSVADCHDEMTTGMLPGRSLAWKLFLIPPAPLTSSLAPTPTRVLLSLRESRQRYVDLLRCGLCAPDGSYEDWVEIPGFDTSTIQGPPSGDNWSRNNPLSLDADSGWHDWFNAVDLRKTIRQDVERTYAYPIADSPVD